MCREAELDFITGGFFGKSNISADAFWLKCCSVTSLCTETPLHHQDVHAVSTTYTQKVAAIQETYV